MEFLICILIAIITIVAIAAPLVYGNGGKLQASSRITDLKELEEVQSGLVETYLREVREFENGQLSQKAWKARSEFLLNRYTDAAHQISRLTSSN